MMISSQRYFVRVGVVLALVLATLLPHHASALPISPEEYTQTVQQLFAKERWAEGKQVLDEALEKYPIASHLQRLMGKYWFQYKDYDKSRYHLIKAVELNYDNVEAKQLLVDVEDVTKNYSSAICYVNELLEVNPYWRGLWRRKIELYRKQGNQVEADRLLKRINQIYPQDTLLRKDLVYSMELNYQRDRRLGDRKKAISTLEELIKSTPNDEVYYLDLINLHLQEGQQEQALAWASRGLAAIPASTALVYKKIGVLSETGRHPEAMAFLNDRMRRTGSTPDMRRLYHTLVLDAARAERQRDPYVLYGVAYESGDHSREVLDYLLNTAIMRGYDDDALLYAREMRRYHGDEKSIMYREYLVYRNKGEDQRAFDILRLLCDRYPDDADLSDALCRLLLLRSTRMMEQQLYVDALITASEITRRATDRETHRAAWERVLVCRIELKRYDEALTTIDTLRLHYPESANLIGKRATILDKTGRTSEALQLYLGAIEHADPAMREYYVAGYAEIAVPHIKRSIEVGATGQAFVEADMLCRVDTLNDLALRYAINAAGELGRDNIFREYTDRGLARYPRDPFYLAKKAAAYDTDKEYERAIALIRPVMWDYPSNRELAGALSQSSEYRALELNREGRTDEALSVIDTALHYDPQNKSLFYTKGLVYEKRKEYELAYFYQKYYEPAYAEQFTFNRHLKGLRYGTFRNEVGLEYLRSRYGEKDAIQTMAAVHYTRKQPKNTYTGRINYAGRNGTTDEEIAAGVTNIQSGGVGIQLQAEWVHQFPYEWQTMINLAWSDRYFPKWMANVSLTKFFKHDWELELRAGYRRLEGRHLLSAGPGVAKAWGPLWLNVKGDFFLFGRKLYYNAMTQLRYYPVSDNRSYIVGMTGVGSAPELSVLDRALPGTFDHANTMVGMGGQYMLLPHLSLGLLGTWHTYYSETIVGGQKAHTRYKNMYNLYVQLFFNF